MIELIDVTKSFGDVPAVDRVSLRVERGEFLTLLGPSGCGKTTLLRMVAGFVTPDTGRVILDGRDVTSLPPYQRDVNQVFQSYALFPHMSVRENVAFGLRMKKLARHDIERRVQEGLALVSLNGLESRKPHELSGGQQQRVALARAIVCEPKVLLLDEPLAALDAKLRQGMQIELKSLQRRLGITFVFVTHDQSEALAMSDRVAVMDRGRIEQVGTPREIYRAPATPFVGNFVGQANVWKGEVVGRDPRTVRVRIASGFEVSVEPARVRESARTVELLVRPERLVLLASRTQDTAIEATIVDEVFAGASSRWRLRTDAGVELQAIVPGVGANIRAGDRVFVTICPTEVVVLDAS